MRKANLTALATVLAIGGGEVRADTLPPICPNPDAFTSELVIAESGAQGARIIELITDPNGRGLCAIEKIGGLNSNSCLGYTVNIQDTRGGEIQEYTGEVLREIPFLNEDGAVNCSLKEVVFTGLPGNSQLISDCGNQVDEVIGDLESVLMLERGDEKVGLSVNTINPVQVDQNNRVLLSVSAIKYDSRGIALGGDTVNIDISEQISANSVSEYSFEGMKIENDRLFLLFDVNGEQSVTLSRSVNIENLFNLNGTRRLEADTFGDRTGIYSNSEMGTLDGLPHFIDENTILTNVMDQNSGNSNIVIRSEDCIDSDGDGVIDSEDNCPDDYNPGQEDGDSNGIGDECDETMGPVDRDGDGVIDSEDNCPETSNEFQDDSDGDGIGDACDACPGEGVTIGKADLDGDGCEDPEQTLNCDGQEIPQTTVTEVCVSGPLAGESVEVPEGYECIGGLYVATGEPSTGSSLTEACEAMEQDLRTYLDQQCEVFMSDENACVSSSITCENGSVVPSVQVSCTTDMSGQTINGECSTPSAEMCPPVTMEDPDKEDMEDPKPDTKDPVIPNEGGDGGGCTIQSTSPTGVPKEVYGLIMLTLGAATARRRRKDTEQVA